MNYVLPEGSYSSQNFAIQALVSKSQNKYVKEKLFNIIQPPGKKYVKIDLINDYFVIYACLLKLRTLP